MNLVYNNGKWNVFSGPVLAGMVVSFLAGIPRKQIKKSDLIIQSSDKYAAPTAQYGYGILTSAWL
jgi:hypothetical protein